MNSKTSMSTYFQISCTACIENFVTNC